MDYNLDFMVNGKITDKNIMSELNNIFEFSNPVIAITNTSYKLK